MGYVAAFHLLLKRKIVTLIYVYYLIWNAYIMAIHKQCFQEVRPFQFDLRIRLDDWICQADYGFPSGHTWVVIFAY